MRLNTYLYSTKNRLIKLPQAKLLLVLKQSKLKTKGGVK